MTLDDDLPRPAFSTDEISLLIGRIVQTHVQLDWTMRALTQQMVGIRNPAHSIVARWNGTSAVAEDLKLMFEDMDGLIDPRFRTAALDAIKAALDACRLRNKAVHDDWTVEGDDLVRLTRFGKRKANYQHAPDQPGPDELKLWLRKVDEAWRRVQAISQYLMAVNPEMSDERRVERIEEWLTVMETRKW